VRKSEKETVIRWDSASRVVTVDSDHPAVWRKVERAGYVAFLSWMRDGREVRKRYEVPLERFRIGFTPLDRPRRPAPRTAFGRNSSTKSRPNDSTAARTRVDPRDGSIVIHSTDKLS
jgi:hypothetical protein